MRPSRRWVAHIGICSRRPDCRGHANDGRVGGDLSGNHQGRLCGGGHCRQLRCPPDRHPAADRGGQGRFYPRCNSARRARVAAVPALGCRRGPVGDCIAGARGRVDRGTSPRRSALGRLLASQRYIGDRDLPSRRDDQCPVFIGHYRRPQGPALDSCQPDQVRRRRALSPRCPLRRCGRLADQFGLDDGAVADLRRLFEPGDHGALLWKGDGARLWGVCAGGWHYHARRHSEHGADLAQHGLHGGNRLFGDSGFQYHRGVLQSRGHALSDGAGGVSAHTRILRRHRTGGRLLAQHASRAGRTRDLQFGDAGNGLGDFGRRRTGMRKRRGLSGAARHWHVNSGTQSRPPRSVL